MSFLEDFDVVVLGEGERTMVELLGAHESSRGFDSVTGIAYRRGALGWTRRREGETVFTRPRQHEVNLDSLAFPARELFPNDKYIDYYRRRFGYAATTVITTRGCPFGCEFCSNAVFGVSYRERSAKNIVDEVEQALALGYDYIHFADDIFTLKKSRVIEMCDEIRNRGLHFKWECLGRVDSIDLDIALAMKEAGCVRVFFGIESGNDSILNLMNKRITVDRARRGVTAAHHAGLKTGAFFILGYPGETDDTVLSTIRFATSLPLDYLSFTLPYPLPGTALHRRLQERVTREWNGHGNFISEHSLIFNGDFSEVKMKLAILKGKAQFAMKKRLGQSASYLIKPFALSTDALFRLLR